MFIKCVTIFIIIAPFMDIILGLPPFSRKGNFPQRVFFPNEDNLRDIKLISNDLIRNCAKGRTYCDNLIRYPKDYFKSVIDKSQYKTVGFFDKLSDTFDDLSNRFYDEDNQLCNYRRLTIFPQIAQNQQNQWRFIFNFGDYRQGVEIEYCISEGTTCKMFSVPFGITSKCKQKYIKRKLIAITDNGQPDFEYFILPSACVCTYTKGMDAFFTQDDYMK